jgi:hypothetical protein
LQASEDSLRRTQGRPIEHAPGIGAPEQPLVIPRVARLPGGMAPRDVTINTPDKSASSPLAFAPIGTTIRAAQQIAGMAEPFRPRNSLEQALPFIPASRGGAETAVGIARATGNSFLDAVATPSVGEERRQNMRAPTPSMPFRPGVYDAAHGGITEQQRALAAAQTIATIGAGPIAGKVEGALAGRVSPFAAKMIGGGVAGAPLGRHADG